ncbi:MAG: hypothetical protein ACO31I_09850 [Prochlorotrichaceae cyanobacterium]|jgi:hypothetical protein
MRSNRFIHLDHQGITARVPLQNVLPLKRPPTLTTRTSSGQISSLKVLKGINTTIAPEDLSPQALLESDPELNWQTGGKVLEMDLMTTAYFDPEADPKIPVSDFQFMDEVYDAKGTLSDRRPHRQRKSNINDTLPLKIGKRISLEKALTTFVFRYTYQLVHEDGVTMDFLYRLAQELDQKQELALLGAGSKGNLPLVLRDKGSPYRGFLYGKVKEDREQRQYKLLLLLSDQELKEVEEDA